MRSNTKQDLGACDFLHDEELKKVCEHAALAVSAAFFSSIDQAGNITDDQTWIPVNSYIHSVAHISCRTQLEARREKKCIYSRIPFAACVISTDCGMPAATTRLVMTTSRCSQLTKCIRRLV